MRSVKWGARVRAAGLGALLVLLLLYPPDAMSAVREAVRLWAQHVMPALFPYMVISSLLVAFTRGRALTMPLAMLGGSPAGARLIALSGASPRAAQRLSALCVTVNPLYILGTLSGDARMLAAHWLGAVIPFAFVCFVTRGGDERSTREAADAAAHPDFSEITRGAVLAMLTVCGYMALFMTLTALLARAFPLPVALQTLLSCLLEMAGGCARILSLGLPAERAAPLLCAAVSFGGLSIFMQNALFLRPAGVNMRLQFAARVLHAGAAYGLCTLAYRFL